MNVYDLTTRSFAATAPALSGPTAWKRAPGLARFLPWQCAAAVRYALGRTAGEAFRKRFFLFLQGVPDADAWRRISGARMNAGSARGSGPEAAGRPGRFCLTRNFCWRPPAAGGYPPAHRLPCRWAHRALHGPQPQGSGKGVAFPGAISGCGDRAVLFRFPLRRAVGAPGTPRLSGPGRFLHLMGGVRLRSRAAAADIFQHNKARPEQANRPIQGALFNLTFPPAAQPVNLCREKRLWLRGRRARLPRPPCTTRSAGAGSRVMAGPRTGRGCSQGIRPCCAASMEHGGVPLRFCAAP